MAKNARPPRYDVGDKCGSRTVVKLLGRKVMRLNNLDQEVVEHAYECKCDCGHIEEVGQNRLVTAERDDERSCSQCKTRKARETKKVISIESLRGWGGI